MNDVFSKWISQAVYVKIGSKGRASHLRIEVTNENNVRDLVVQAGGAAAEYFNRLLTNTSVMALNY